MVRVGISGSIALITIGAILAFGVTASVGWLDVSIVGWVFMVAGVIGLILSLSFWRTRPKEVLTHVPARDFKVVEEKKTEIKPPDKD